MTGSVECASQNVRTFATVKVDAALAEIHYDLSAPRITLVSVTRDLVPRVKTRDSDKPIGN